MTVLSAGEITLLRTTPHRTNLFLSIYKPATVFAATISDGSPTQGQVMLSYDNAIGTFSNAHEGMTILIGTTPGAKDLGRLRFRSIVNLGGGTGTITVAENSVVWANGAYITITAFYEPWAIYPRIIHNPSTDVPTVYKDYDIVYTNQNSVFDPVPMMGPHMAAILQSGVASLYFDGSASYDFSAGGLTFSWTFEGGTPATSAVATPGNVTWSTPGHYVVTLHVANSVTGKDYVSHRHISIYNAIGGANPPIVNWSLQQLSGDFEAGGWNGRISLREAVDPSIVVDNAQVVIFADDWYGSTKQSIGGNYPNREKIVFVGYIRNGSISIDPETNEVSFEITTLDGRLQAEEVFAISVVAASAPVNWFELLNPTVDLSVYHYLRWHSTVYGIADVSKIGDTLQLEQADFSHAFLFGSVDQFVQSTLIGKCAVDRQGKVWLQKRLEIVPVVSRTPGTILSSSRLDWLNQLTIREQRERPVSLQEVGGVFYEGPTTGFFLSLISTAPGYVMEYEGNPQVINGLVLENQAVTNQLSGNVLTMRNKRFPEVHMPFIGNYRCVDIMPQERLLLTVAVAETYLGLVWTEKKFIPRTISFQYDRANSILQVETTVTEESDGPPGVTGPYPQVPPDEPEPVPIPPPPPDPGGTQPQPTPETVYVACEGRLKRSRNFVSATNPIWTSIKGSISGTISDFDRDPFSPTRRAVCATTSGLWLTNSLSGTPPSWVLVYTAAQFTADTGATLTAIRNVRHTAAKKNCIYMQVVTASNHIFVGRTTDRGVTWTWVDIGVAGTMNANEGLGFSVSHHTADKLWTAGGDGKLYECTNGTGAFTFTLKYTLPSASSVLTNILVPYQGNPTDQVIYIAGHTTVSVPSSFAFPSDAEGWVWSLVSGSGGSGAWDGADGHTANGCLSMNLNSGAVGKWKYTLPAGYQFAAGATIKVWAKAPTLTGSNLSIVLYTAGGIDTLSSAMALAWTQYTLTVVHTGSDVIDVELQVTNGDFSAHSGYKFDDVEFNGGSGGSATVIYKSTDAGGSFSNVSPSVGGAIGKFGMAANDTNNVYVLVGNSPTSLDLEKTANGGSSWSDPQPAQSSPVGIAAWPYDDVIVLWLTAAQIKYSANNGVTAQNKTGNFSDYANPVVIDAEWAQ